MPTEAINNALQNIAEIWYINRGERYGSIAVKFRNENDAKQSLRTPMLKCFDFTTFISVQTFWSFIKESHGNLDLPINPKLLRNFPMYVSSHLFICFFKIYRANVYFLAIFLWFLEDQEVILQLDWTQSFSYISSRHLTLTITLRKLVKVTPI